MDNENKNGQETGRVTSIARKINRQYVWEKFCTFFWWNLILLLLLAAVFIYQEDRQNLGRFSWSYLREIGWDEIWYTLPNGNQGMAKNMNMEEPLLKEGDFPLEDMWYRVTAGAGTTGEKSYKIASLDDEDFEFAGKKLQAYTFLGVRHSVSIWKDSTCHFDFRNH